MSVLRYLGSCSCLELRADLPVKNWIRDRDILFDLSHGEVYEPRPEIGKTRRLGIGHNSVHNLDHEEENNGGK